ncbi:MAG: hypothetical protein LBJ31_11550 [Treponema sp.]|jgi:hypothetical protein|nr:hypothetical protein [Treponema sp.]
MKKLCFVPVLISPAGVKKIFFVLVLMAVGTFAYSQNVAISRFTVSNDELISQISDKGVFSLFEDDDGTYTFLLALFQKGTTDFSGDRKTIHTLFNIDGGVLEGQNTVIFDGLNINEKACKGTLNFIGGFLYVFRVEDLSGRVVYMINFKDL